MYTHVPCVQTSVSTEWVLFRPPWLMFNLCSSLFSPLCLLLNLSSSLFSLLCLLFNLSSSLFSPLCLLFNLCSSLFSPLWLLYYLCSSLIRPLCLLCVLPCLAHCAYCLTSVLLCLAHSSFCLTGMPPCLDPCAAGSFFSCSMRQCLACPRDSYQPQWGQTACWPCPNATHTDGPGATSPAQCKLTDCGRHVRSAQLCFTIYFKK